MQRCQAGGTAWNKSPRCGNCPIDVRRVQYAKRELSNRLHCICKLCTHPIVTHIKWDLTRQCSVVQLCIWNTDVSHTSLSHRNPFTMINKARQTLLMWYTGTFLTDINTPTSMQWMQWFWGKYIHHKQHIEFGNCFKDPSRFYRNKSNINAQNILIST